MDEVLRGGMISRGKLVREFENSVAEYLGVSGGIACNSGTAALLLALKALGIGFGDEVVLPTYVCRNVLAAVYAVGAIPCLCDVDHTGVITEDAVRAVVNARTRAIIAVHIFGHTCDVADLFKLGLPVIEDACQAFGLEIDNGRAGAIGTIGILSFHATKCLTTGEGGMLVTSDLQLLDRARALVESAGQDTSFSACSTSDIQAALGLAQLGRYPEFLLRRREMLAIYHQVTSSLNRARPGYLDSVQFLFRYTLHTECNFEDAQSDFLARGVQVRRGVDALLHRQLGLDDVGFPRASRLFSQVVSLPFHPSLSIVEQTRVLRAVKEVFGSD